MYMGSSSSIGVFLDYILQKEKRKKEELEEAEKTMYMGIF